MLARQAFDIYLFVKLGIPIKVAEEYSTPNGNLQLIKGFDWHVKTMFEKSWLRKQYNMLLESGETIHTAREGIHAFILKRVFPNISNKILIWLSSSDSNSFIWDFEYIIQHAGYKHFENL